MHTLSAQLKSSKYAPRLEREKTYSFDLSRGKQYPTQLHAYFIMYKDTQGLRFQPPAEGMWSRSVDLCLSLPFCLHLPFHFLTQLKEKSGKKMVTISNGFVALAQSPGNNPDGKKNN